MNSAHLEHAAVEAVSRIAPWLAPLPTAYAAYSAGQTLGWPQWVAVGAALAVETLGLATTATALTLRDYNRSKRKIDPPAPVALALTLVIVYYITALALVLLYEPPIAGWGRFVPVLFPFLSLAGVGVLALRADHRRRMAEIEADKRRRKRSRAPDEHQLNARRYKWADKWATIDDYKQDLRANGDLRQSIAEMTGAQFAAMTGKPPSTSRRWVALAKNGYDEVVIIE